MTMFDQPSCREVENGVKEFITNRAETIVLASQEKLGAASPYLITGWEEISTMIVAKQVTDSQLAAYGNLGITIARTD